MSRLWTTGFELNSLTAGVEFDTITNATARLSIQSTTVRSGGFALQATNTVATDDDASITHVYLPSGGNSNNHYFRFYFRLATSVSAAHLIMNTLDVAGAVQVVGLNLNTDDTLTLRDTGNITSIGSNSSALSKNTWYRIEVAYLFHATTPTVTAYIDGVQFASGLLANNGNNNPSRITLGLQGLNFTGSAFFDDVAINDSAAGGTQTGLPGDGSVKLLVPTATGDSAGWTPFGAANWQNTDDIPPNDATDWNSINTLNAVDLFNITNSGIGSGDAVKVVHVGGRFNNAIASTNTAFKFRVEKAAAGTKSDSAAIIPNSTTWRTNAKASPFVWPLTLYLDPDGAAWTQTTLDSAQIGYILSTNGTQAVQVSGVWMLFESSAQASASVAQVAGTLTATGGTQAVTAVSNSSITQAAANLTTAGGTQSVAAAGATNASVTQVAATLTTAGGTQAVAAVQSVSIAQVAANLITTGGTQVIAALVIASISIAQVAASLTGAGGTQAIATVNNVSISQSAATLTASGGTQAIATVNSVGLTQSAAALTATGGTQLAQANTADTQAAATLTMTGGTQSVATVNIVSLAQVAANLITAGGTQAVATTRNVAIAQVTGNLTAAGGTQSVATVNKVAVSQVAANITASGGTQSVGAQIDISINQVAAAITATGGTQTVATFQQVAITQAAATLTATGGTQLAQANSLIAQAAANLTATGGTQTIATVNNVAPSQVAANLTTTGGTQAVATTRIAGIAQVAVPLIISGGTQSANAQIDVSITQAAANLTTTGGTQSVVAGTGFVNAAVTQVAATLTARGGSQVIITSTGPLAHKKYYLDTDGNIYWIISQRLGLLEKV